MTSIIIRQATAADAAAISAVHRSNIDGWTIWESDGAARPARYGDLTPYQRWLNGGPWLDPDLCAAHLLRLASGGGVPWVAERNGRLLAEAEAYTAEEPPPFGRNLNLSVLYVHRSHHRQGLGSALLRHALAVAEAGGCNTLTVARVEAPKFYARHGLRRAACYAAFRLEARPSAVGYAVEPLPDGPYDVVRGFGLLIGRYQNARHDWERVRPGGVPGFSAWRHLRLERYWLALDGVRSAVIFEESPHHPGAANLFLFAPAALSTRLLAVVNDRAARSGFRYLHCFAPADFPRRIAGPASGQGEPAPDQPFGIVRMEDASELFLKRLQ